MLPKFSGVEYYDPVPFVATWTPFPKKDYVLPRTYYDGARAHDYWLRTRNPRSIKMSHEFIPWNDRNKRVLAARAAKKNYFNNRQIVPYKATVRPYYGTRTYRSGYNRTSGYYGRFLTAAKATGMAPELKFKDFNLVKTIEVATSPTNPVQADCLTAIIQEDNQSGRDGREATIKSIQITGIIGWDPQADEPTGSFTGMTNFLQIFLILDRQCNGALPIANNIFDSNFSTASKMVLLLENSKRFKILKKWRFTFNPSSIAITNDPVTGGVNHSRMTPIIKEFKYYKKCNYLIEYSNGTTTGAVSTIRSNNIFLVYSKSGNGGGTDIEPALTIDAIARIRFTG